MTTNKWMKQEGLRAIFSDVALAPYHFSKAFIDFGKARGEEPMGKMLSVGGHLPALFIGIGVGTSLGPVAGVAAYYLFTNAYMGMLALSNEKLCDSFFPSMTAYHANKPS